jgi:hypothetical protein
MRRVFVETLYAVAIWRRRLEFHAQSKAPRALIFALLRDLAQLPEDEALRLCPTPLFPVKAGPTALGEVYSFPDWLVE